MFTRMYQIAMKYSQPGDGESQRRNRIAGQIVKLTRAVSQP